MWRSPKREHSWGFSPYGTRGSDSLAINIYSTRFEGIRVVRNRHLADRVSATLCCCEPTSQRIRNWNIAALRFLPVVRRATIPSRVLLGSPSGPVFRKRVCGRFLDCLWNISISGCRIPDCKAQVFNERMDEVYKIGLLPRAPARSISCRTLHYVALAFPGRSPKVRSRCRWRRGRLRQTERR